MVHLMTLPETWNIGYSVELYKKLLNNYLENTTYVEKKRSWCSLK